MNWKVRSFGLTALFAGFFSFAAAEEQTPPSAAPAEYRPSIADMMNIGVQPRHIKIGLAVKEQNWEYLNYEVNELKTAFTRITRTIPRINNRYDTAELIRTMMASPLEQLANSVKQKDVAQTAAAYDAVTAGCNACHQAVVHSMIVIKAPGSEFFPDQEFRAH